MAKYAQKITHFFCRPCGEYHEKTHPHYRAQKRRAAKRRKQAQAEAQTESKA
jgi:hypothetical protein